MVSALAFDTVKLDGRCIVIEDFLALPLATRVAAIIEKRVVFLAAGKTMDTALALQQLRAHRAVRAT